MILLDVAAVMTQHVPTSRVLDRLLDDAPPDEVTLAWIMEQPEQRSFGILMLVMALVGLVPDASTVIGALLVLPAVMKTTDLLWRLSI